MTPWSWFAGEIDAEAYDLACDVATREEAVREALAQLRPGERFQVIEARSSEAIKHEGGIVPFLRTRNHEIMTAGVGDAQFRRAH